MTKLFVIPGHGAGDPGACGHGYEEAERVRALAKRIKDLGGSDVILADFNRDYYADDGISRLDIDSDTCIVELHMDSGASSARGGHVIIQAGVGGPDGFDRNLESLMRNIFPGRSNTLVERDDLANPWRAANMGFNYRLVENGFISNADDVAVFNSRIDDIARGYLAAFGIASKSGKDWPVHAYHSNGTAAQKWRMSKNPDGTFTFTSCANGKALDVIGAGTKSGTGVQSYDPNGTPAQKWKLEQVKELVDGSKFDPPETAPYEISPACAPELRLDVKGASSADGTQIQIYTRNRTTAQLWYVLDNADGTFTLMNDSKGAKVVIDVVGGGK